MNREELKARVLWAIDQVCKQEFPAWDNELGICVYEDTETKSHCIAGWFYKDTEIWEKLRDYHGGLDDFHDDSRLLDKSSLEFEVLCNMQERHDKIVGPKTGDETNLRDALMEVFYRYFPEEKVVASNT